MERELPIIDIEGTDFIVDVQKEELREKDSPLNVMKIKAMHYNGPHQGYYFTYDRSTRNFPEMDKFMAEQRSVDLVNVEIPELNKIDPIGTAEKYNVILDKARNKSDFELAIKPGSPLDLRFNKNILPILEIEGHPFYVDLQMNKLRPKDDFKSKGIDFGEIREYFSRRTHCYVIPYNPVTRQFQENDVFSLTDLPKETIVVQFPHESSLDPVGWGRKHGNGYISRSFEGIHFLAQTLPWFHTNIIEHIKRNVAEQLRPKEEFTDIYAAAQDSLYRIPTDAKRILPTYDILGTTFIVDVNELVLRQKSKPLNIISIADMDENPQEGYRFWYDPNNCALGSYFDLDAKQVVIPDFVKLDPMGMAKKHGISDDDIIRMNDFQIMVDQEIFEKINQKFYSPVIDIAGHIFDIDVYSGRLHPRDDIWSRGIMFSELSYYYFPKDKSYIIPYNTSTHTFQEISLNVKEIPDDLIIVKIPEQRMLDPISKNRLNDMETCEYLKKIGLSLHHEAKIISWEHTQFLETISQNKKQGYVAEQKMEPKLKAPTDSDDPGKPKTEKRMKPKL